MLSDELKRKHMDSMSEGSRVFKFKSVLINEQLSLLPTHTHTLTHQWEQINIEVVQGGNKEKEI